ncbi:MAG: 7-carboxy-7-deazaguanine synthase QueE [Chitinophagales bacterium]
MKLKPSSKVNFDEQVNLPVMERFYTIQGEGFHQGKAAYFIRLAGCTVGCTWCDVKESWDAEDHELISIQKLKQDLKHCKAEIVVVTGGEPTMYNLSALTEMIASLGKRCHIETSGAFPITGNWDWICLSPKKFKKALPENLAICNELKVIIAHKNDFRFAQKFESQVASSSILYLQPEWSTAEELMPEIISFVKDNPKYRISLQIHKYLNVP